MKKAISIIGVSSILAAVSGFAVSQAIGQEPPTPTQTVTVTLKNGEPGPQGPPGPQGLPGATECRAGSTLSDLELNTPGGHVTLTNVCIKN